MGSLGWDDDPSGTTPTLSCFSKLTAMFPATRAPTRHPIEKIPVMTDCLDEAMAQTPSAVHSPNRAERRRKFGQSRLESRSPDEERILLTGEIRHDHETLCRGREKRANFREGKEERGERKVRKGKVVRQGHASLELDDETT